MVVDAGMTELLRPSLYQARHAIRVVNGGGTPGDRARARVDVVGPVCESGDFLGLDIPLARPDAGSLLAVLGVGAYGFSMSSTYNSRPRPAEVLVDGDRWAVIRSRDTFEDLVRGECVPERWEQ